MGLKVQRIVAIISFHRRMHYAKELKDVEENFPSGVWSDCGKGEARILHAWRASSEVNRLLRKRNEWAPLPSMNLMNLFKHLKINVEW